MIAQPRAATTQRQTLSNETVQRWKVSGDKWQKVAAGLVEKIHDGRLHAVPDTGELADAHEVSTSTALKAKLYLVEIGYLTADRQGFYVNGGD
jgi:DNA-binding GntR family transcriptional regulator